MFTLRIYIPPRLNFLFCCLCVDQISTIQVLISMWSTSSLPRHFSSWAYNRKDVYVTHHFVLILVDVSVVIGLMLADWESQQCIWKMFLRFVLGCSILNSTPAEFKSTFHYSTVLMLKYKNMGDNLHAIYLC